MFIYSARFLLVTGHRFARVLSMCWFSPEWRSNGTRAFTCGSSSSGARPDTGPSGSVSRLAENRTSRFGRPAFFLTGSGGTALWRLARLEADALNRLVLTLQPVRLAHGLAVPSFDQVSDTALRAYLTEQFEAFQRAVASGAHLEVVDRSANIAEGVLDYCLSGAGRDVPRTLAERLTAARGVLEEKELRGKVPLTSHANHLAHKIRELHARINADQD